jgi:hypothetical protein
MTMKRGIALALILGFATEAWAITFNEIGNAGIVPAFSQAAGVLPLLTTITGSIGPSDVDMFAITISKAGAFSATTVGTPGSLVDTQLFFFRFPGLGVVANDDSKGTLRSTVQGVPVTPGLYFLGISSFDTDPESPGGLIFPSFPFTGVFGPTGPGGGSAVTGWLNTGGTSPMGTYSIALDLQPPQAVPEPATLLLVGTTMAGLGLARLRQWRRKRESGAQA